MNQPSHSAVRDRLDGFERFLRIDRERGARTIAAYRDRYAIAEATPLGPAPEDAAQKIDTARARTALERAQVIAHPYMPIARSRPTGLFTDECGVRGRGRRR